MVVFVFSNTYLTRATIHFLEFFSLNSEVIESICILSDKHTIEEFPNNMRKKLIIKNSFEECLEFSDFCLIVKDAHYSSCKIELLISLAKKNKLQYYCIELESDSKLSVNKLSHLEHIPTILVLNYGEYSQQYCTELALSYAFHKREIRVSQQFSPVVAQFIKRIQDIIPFRSNDEGIDIKLSVISCQNQILDNYESDNEIREIIHQINPQYVILTTNNGAEITAEIKKHVYYLYNVSIDCVVRSTFTPLLIANRTIPMVTNCPLDSTILFAEDPYLADKLFEKIEQKLVVPKGIHLI